MFARDGHTVRVGVGGRRSEELSNRELSIDRVNREVRSKREESRQNTPPM